MVQHQTLIFVAFRPDFQPGFSVILPVKNIVISLNQQHPDIRMGAAPISKFAPFCVEIAVKQITQKNNPVGLVLSDEAVEPAEVGIVMSARQRDAAPSEGAGFSEMGVSEVQRAGIRTVNRFFGQELQQDVVEGELDQSDVFSRG